MKGKNADKEVDKIVGARIHELRLAMGLSRVQLAEKIGVTHQQLQKYEKGMNRICISRLLAVAKALRKSTTYFLMGLHDEEAEHQEIPTQHQRLALEVSRGFMKIGNPAHQVAVGTLVRALAENN